MSKNITRAQVVATVRRVDEIVAQWSMAMPGEAPSVTWRGKPRQAITEAMIEAWAALTDSVETQDVDADAQSIVLKIDGFTDALDRWAEMCELAPEDADPRGSRELWSAWDEVTSSLAAPTPKRLEPIAQLLKVEKVPERQVALMYGWTHADGSPDVGKVREEFANPGTHFDASTWVHPEQARQAKEIATLWRGRAERIGGRAAAGAGPASAPESLDDLIRQDVPSKQIASMKQITVDQVRQRAAELGVMLDGQFVPSVSPHDRMQDVRDADAQRRAQLQQMASDDRRPADSATLPERILSLAAAGHAPKEIADMLGSDHPNLTYQKVQGILRNASEQEPAAV